MNSARRKHIEQAAAILAECRDDEQLARDNLPEGISEGETGDKMDENVGVLSDAVDLLREVDGVEIY